MTWKHAAKQSVITKRGKNNTKQNKNVPTPLPPETAARHIVSSQPPLNFFHTCIVYTTDHAPSRDEGKDCQ
eukprot:9602010-Prorocentrum_lima.AAC.1